MRAPGLLFFLLAVSPCESQRRLCTPDNTLVFVSLLIRELVRVPARRLFLLIEKLNPVSRSEGFCIPYNTLLYVP